LVQKKPRASVFEGRGEEGAPATVMFVDRGVGM